MASKEGHKVKLPAEKSAAAHRLLLEWKSKETGLTVASIADQLAEFCDNKLKNIPDDPIFAELEIEDFFSQQTAIYRAIKSTKFSGDRIGKAFYLFFRNKDAKLLRKIEEGEALILKEPFVRAAHNLMGYGDILDVPYAKSLAGEYKLYRPFYVSPYEQISVCLFEIGSRTSPYDCRFETRFEENGRINTHRSNGKIMPHHNQRGRLSAITTGPEKISSHFIFHFDYIDEEEGLPFRMAGNLISSFGLEDSSSWPLYAERVFKGEKFVPHIADISEISKLPELAQERFRRGFIHWKNPKLP